MNNFSKIVLATLICLFRLAATDLDAQVNADHHFVKKKAISSASFQRKNEYSGVIFKYDTQGRLYHVVYYEWYPYQDDGYSSVETYDTLGRVTSVKDYVIKDSTFSKDPGNSVAPSLVNYWIYIGDSIEIFIDTAWDRQHRVVQTERSELTTVIEKMPAPGTKRSVYHSNYYISTQLYFDSKLKYYYEDEFSMNPDSVSKSGNVLMRNTEVAGNRITEIEHNDFFRAIR